MNFRSVAQFLGYVLKVEAGFMLLPLFVALFYREHMSALAFAGTIAGAFVAGTVLDTIKVEQRNIYARDGFVIVAICWVACSLVGALPFWISREIPSYIDALFEAVSGFTTTGASILTDVEVLPRGILFWRSFTHWIGGMGVLLFLLAVLPASGERTVHIMKAESPGPAPGKLVPKLRQSAELLYGIYISMTVVLFGLLLLGGMPLFDSVVNALGTAGTGGFAVKNASIAFYDSFYLEMVITVFMILFGVNFNIYYFLLVRNFSGIRKNDELRWYLIIILASFGCITVNLWRSGMYPTLLESFRYSFFQVGSIITTTGFATANFDLWPQLSRIILFFLMFIGGCGGSTAGGFKVSRGIILVREIKRTLYQTAHPRSVEIVKLDGKLVERETVYGAVVYGGLYMILFVLSFLVVSIDNFSFETAISAVASCFNNVGPGFGEVSPVGNFYAFSILSKLILTFDMLLGRLEIYPILLLILPSTWRKI